MGTKVTTAPTPAPRDLGGEYRETAQAKLDMMPQQFASEEEWRKQWAGLDLDTLAYGLGGDAWDTSRMGLLDIYQQMVAPSLSQTESAAARAQAEGRLGTIEQYGGRMTAALLGADPEKKALSDRLIGEANREMDLGASMDSGLARQVSQYYRGGEQARGFAPSRQGARGEAEFMGMQAEQLRRNRQQFGMQVLGQRQALTGDPSLALIGQPSQVFAAAPQYASGAGGMGGAGQMFAPGQYESGLYGMNYQGALQNQALQTQASMASAQGRNAMMGGIIGGIGSMGAGLFGGIGAAASGGLAKGKTSAWSNFWG